MDLLTEFRSLAAQARRKTCKQIEDEAIIAACEAIEYWLKNCPHDLQGAAFEQARQYYNEHLTKLAWKPGTAYVPGVSNW